MKTDFYILASKRSIRIIGALKFTMTTRSTVIEYYDVPFSNLRTTGHVILTSYRP